MMRTYLRPFLMLLLVGLIGASGFRAGAQDQPTPTLPPEYSEHVSAVAWSPDGKFIAVGDWNGQINIVDSSGQQVRALKGHTTPVSTLDWNSTGTQLVSGSLNPDPSVRIWNVATGQIIREFISIGDGISVVDWTPNDHQIIVIPSAGDKSVFDASTGNLVATINIGTANTIKWSPDSSKIAFPLLYGGIDIRDATNYQNITNLGANSGKISGSVANQIISMAWKPDNSAVAVGTWGGNVLIWNVSSGQLTFEQRGNDYQGTDRFLSFVEGLRFSNDGTKLTSISGNGTTRTWNASTGQLLESTLLPSPIYAVDWSPDGSQIAYGGEGSSIQIVLVADLMANADALLAKSQ